MRILRRPSSIRGGVARAIAAGGVIAFAALAACSSARPPAAGEGDAPPGAAARDASLDRSDAGDAAEPADDAAADAGSSCLGDDLAPEADAGADADAEPDEDGGRARVACDVPPGCKAACEHVVHHYRLGVAEDAVRCMRAKPSCDGDVDVVTCVDQAMAKACPLPTSPSFCKPLVAGCVDDTGDAAGAFSEFGCETFANALAPDGRATFGACVSKTISAGTCATGVAACADEIRK